MILENKVVKILQEDMPDLFRQIQWDGMYDKTAELIVQAIKNELFQ